MIVYTAALTGQLSQLLGALLILAAFVASQIGLVSTDSIRYLTLNLVGSAVLAVVAVAEMQLGFILLEGVGRSSPPRHWCVCCSPLVDPLNQGGVLRGAPGRTAARSCIRGSTSKRSTTFAAVTR